MYRCLLYMKILYKGDFMKHKEIIELLNEMTIDEKIGQMIKVD